MSVSLVPDAAERFFGVRKGTPLYEKYVESAKSLGYHGGWGAPQTPDEVAAMGDRTQTWAPR
jgi:hypothetical protein